MLKYSLSENQLNNRTDDYLAYTHSSGSLDKEAVITRMLSRGTLLTRTDILAVLNNLEETTIDAILEGYTINLPLFKTSFSVSGVFESPIDNFDRNRHKLNVNFNKGILIRDAEKEVKLEKMNAVSPQPQIQEIKDSISKKTDEVLTSRGVVEVRGYNLKIEGDDTACGLWFVHENGDEIQAEIIIENKPSKIIAIIPLLDNGNYQVKIVTQHTGSATLVRAPKVFVYQKSLVVSDEE